jgi:hypothetical protein
VTPFFLVAEGQVRQERKQEKEEVKRELIKFIGSQSNSLVERRLCRRSIGCLSQQVALRNWCANARHGATTTPGARPAQ